MTDQPADLFRDELVSTSGEREVLEAFLDLYREIVVSKARGLTREQANLRHVPTLTTVIGVVRHLAAVERYWFQAVLDERGRDNVPGDTGDGGWLLAEDESVDSVIDDYLAACEESRQIAAGRPLGDTVPHRRMGRVSLRWIYVHMIEETARHAGHADILRELTDGRTGFDPE